MQLMKTPVLQLLVRSLWMVPLMLLMPSHAQGQFQISAGTEWDYHCDDGEVVGVLTSTGHTYPIIIDWDFGYQVDTVHNDQEYQIARVVWLVCYSALCNYNVKVTNSDGQIRTWDFVSVYPMEWGLGDYTFDPYPYMPGDTVRCSFYFGTAQSITVSASTPGIGPQPIAYDVNCTNSCVGTWKALLPEGSIVTYSGYYECGFPINATVTIGPPTVLPSWMVVDVEGSCANASTGRITLFAASEVPGPWPASTGRVRLRRVADNTLVNTVLNLSPGQTVTTIALAAGSYWVSVVAGPYVEVTDSVLVVVPDLGGTCGWVQGYVFVDNNEDCIQGSWEPRVPEAVLEILPGPYYMQTSVPPTVNNNFDYRLLLPTGSYTISMTHPQVVEHCTGEPFPFAITGTPSTVFVNLPTLPTVPLDVGVALDGGPARPGFELHYAMKVRNLTPAASGATTVTFTFDPLLTLISATPAPDALVGNTITWNSASLTAWQSRNYRMNFQVPPDPDLLGHELEAVAQVSAANTDGNLDNNSAIDLRVITGAYDPNDKLARTSSGSDTSWLPGEDQWVDYTIRFQNTGTDTAFNVLITDTLPLALDPASIVVGAASHDHTWLLRGNGILKFAFPGILLPDSNVNEPASHGFVSFRIKMREGMMTDPGDEVVNIANIYFDFNPPIITDPCVLVVPEPPVQALLDLKLFLGGPYDPDSGLMNDELRSQGLLPLQEPYSALGYVYTAGGGDEGIQPAVLAVEGPEAIVDWVVVELRDVLEMQEVVVSRAALLRRDGRIVDLDGSSPVLLPTEGVYLPAVLHRNHLPVMSTLQQNTMPAWTGIAMEFDFTLLPSAFVYGNAPMKEEAGVMVLWPGDVTHDGQVKYTGIDNDRDAVLQGIGGANPVNVVQGTYATEDVNMDGTIKYTGASNDRDVILQTIGGVVPTAIRVEQVP